MVVFCPSESECPPCPLPFCRKFRFHFLNEVFQLFLAFLAGMGVDVATALFAVGIFASSAVFTELTDATGPLLSPR